MTKSQSRIFLVILNISFCLLFIAATNISILTRQFFNNVDKVYRNHILWSDDVTKPRNVDRTHLSSGLITYNTVASKATVLGISLNSFFRFDAVNHQKALNTNSGTTIAIDQTLQYRQAVQIQNLSTMHLGTCFSLLMNLSNATRIEQDSLLGFVQLHTKQNNLYFKPIYVGVDIAEWAHNFPDMAPRHQRPQNYVALATGGDVYPVNFVISPNEDADFITVVFLYPQWWHVMPSWQIINLSSSVNCDN